MVTVMNRVFIKTEFAEAFELAFRNRPGAVDGSPGFVSNQVLKPTKSGEPYIVLTLWESRDDFQAWVKSDAFKQAHSGDRRLGHDAFSAPSVIEIHDVMLDSSRPELAEIQSGLDHA